MTSARFRPRKRFGQNFLRDANALSEIASLIRAKPSDHLVEIGPGQGALTELLLASCPSMRAIEIDRDLCAALALRFPELRLIEGDVLSGTFETLLESEQDWRLVGNLPYNISTPLLARVAQHAPRIRDAWFLLQREVAMRLAAEPGTRDWSRLTILVRLSFHAEIALILEPECFYPAPKVTSCLVHLKAKPSERRIISQSVFERLVLQAFTQRRKTLANALQAFSINWNETSVNPSMRPDQIGIDAFVELANHVASKAASAERSIQ